MGPKADFASEMDAAFRLAKAEPSGKLFNIDVLRLASTLAVKLCTLLSKGSVGAIDIRKVRCPKPWSISTYDMTIGLGFTVDKDSWKKRGNNIDRTIEKSSSLNYISADTRALRFSSIPGVSHILEDDDIYRLYMTHRDLFSNTTTKLWDWKDHQLLKIDTKHMLDRSLEESYHRYLSDRAKRDGVSLPPLPLRQPASITITNAEVVRWYRNIGIHSPNPEQHPHQLIAEKLPSGEFFVRPLTFNSRKEYFRTVLGFRPMRNLTANLVILLASEVYGSLTGTSHNAISHLDIPKLDPSSSDSPVDITTVASVPSVRGEVAKDMIRRVDGIDRVVDERDARYRDYDGPSVGRLSIKR